MTSTLKPVPSADRVLVDQEPALADFLERFGSPNGTYTCLDIGPHLTCSEAESLADLLAAHGKHHAADSLRDGHLDDCDDRELHLGGPCPDDVTT